MDAGIWPNWSPGDQADCRLEGGAPPVLPFPCLLGDSSSHGAMFARLAGGGRDMVNGETSESFRSNLARFHS